jgi:hypothetical protein
VPSLRCVPISDSKYPKLLEVQIFFFNILGWLGRP